MKVKSGIVYFMLAAVLMPAAAFAQVPAATTPTLQGAQSPDAMQSYIQKFNEVWHKPAQPAAAPAPAAPLQLPIPGAKDISQTPAFLQNVNNIYNDPATPTFGNPNGDVTIVEYYDYLCPHCKASESGLEKLLQEDSNIKMVYKDFPMLSDMSFSAAAASLASLKQGNDAYLKFHQLLLNPQTVINSYDAIYNTAAAAGLNVNQLKRDMLNGPVASPNRAIDLQIQHNLDVGKSIGVTGIPTFIINGYFISGERDYDSLKKMVAYVRSLKKAPQ